MERDGGASPKHPGMDRIKDLIERLWLDEESKDLRIICKGNSFVLGHVVILACASPFMANLLKDAISSSEEETSGAGRSFLPAVVYLDDFDPEEVSYVLQMCYLLRCPTDSVESHDLMTRAKVLCDNLGIALFETFEDPKATTENVTDLLSSSFKKNLSREESSLNSSSDEDELFFLDLSKGVTDGEDNDDDGDESMESLDEDFVGEEEDPSDSQDGIRPKRMTSRSLTKNKKASRSTTSFSELCPYCGKKFTDRVKLRSHILREERAEPRCCDWPGCSFTSFFKRQLALHKKVEHGDVAETVCVKCDECDLQVRNLASHRTRFHDPSLPIQCKQCTCRFSTDRGLKIHETKFHGSEGDHECKCGASFAKKTKLARHVKFECSASANSYNVCCDLCSFRAKSAKTLSIHKAKMHEEKKYACKCGVEYNSRQALSRHMKLRCQMHSGNGKLGEEYLDQCDRCPAKVADLEHHYAKVHDEKLPFACDLCFWRFKNERSLKNHKESAHSGRVFHCEACGKEFGNYQAKWSHYKFACDSNSERADIKNGRKIVCSKCPYTTFTKLGLKIHESRAHQSLQYVCKCGKSFSKEKALNAHVRKRCSRKEENLEEWLQCDQCPFKARTKRAILVHKGKHHNDGKKFVCECGVEYTRQSKLNTHRRKNCLLNEGRENQKVHYNCPKPVLSTLTGEAEGLP